MNTQGSPHSITIGTILLAIPLLLVAGAWLLYARENIRLSPRQRGLALLSLIAVTLTLAEFCLMPALAGSTSSDVGLTRYMILGKIGMWMAVLATLAALGTAGQLRIVGALAGLGVLAMWSTIGFYPFR